MQMQDSLKQCAFASCMSVMVCGCAVQQNATPEYRISTSASAAIDGASMLQRGRAQLDAGLEALAIESFRAEIRVNPDNADAYNGLAVAYGRIGRNDLAQRYFETALATDPSNAKAQTNLARLNGGTAPLTQLAVLEEIPVKIEPVSVVALTAVDPIGDILGIIETPDIANANLPTFEQVDKRPDEILARQGVLSTRFAFAPARIATQFRLPPRPSEQPEKLPHSPKPALPPANLPSEYRTTGARLERVSLGEVRLITNPEVPLQPRPTKPDFASFGDRLATWLPQSVATEQAATGHGMIDSEVIMAAIVRAEKRQKLADVADIVTPDVPEFAYLFFDDGTASV
jgi:hypothetical protein